MARRKPGLARPPGRTPDPAAKAALKRALRNGGRVDKKAYLDPQRTHYSATLKSLAYLKDLSRTPATPPQTSDRRRLVEAAGELIAENIDAGSSTRIRNLNELGWLDQSATSDQVIEWCVRSLDIGIAGAVMAQRTQNFATLYAICTKAKTIIAKLTDTAPNRRLKREWEIIIKSWTAARALRKKLRIQRGAMMRGKR